MLYQHLLMGSKPYQISVAQMNAFEMHRHSEVEFLYCLEGDCDVVIQRKTIHLTACQLCMTGSMFPHAILHEASVSFLGYGLPPEQPAIGIILAESMKYISAGMWWPAVVPGLVMVLIVLLVDRLGDNLRMIIDPYSAQD